MEPEVLGTPSTVTPEFLGHFREENLITLEGENKEDYVLGRGVYYWTKPKFTAKPNRKNWWNRTEPHMYHIYTHMFPYLPLLIWHVPKNTLTSPLNFTLSLTNSDTHGSHSQVSSTLIHFIYHFIHLLSETLRLNWFPHLLNLSSPPPLNHIPSITAAHAALPPTSMPSSPSPPVRHQPLLSLAIVAHVTMKKMSNVVFHFDLLWILLYILLQLQSMAVFGLGL